MAAEINSYLTFKLKEESFGLNVAKVMEIKEYVKPRPMPQSLSFVTGVTEYNDEIIPIIDAGLKFGMDPVEITLSTCAIILQLVSNTHGKTYRVAILVDMVSDVFESGEEDIKPISDDYSPEYIAGTYTYDDKFVYILNADNIFNQKEVIHILDILDKTGKK